MTPRELEMLNTIYQFGGQASLGVISKKTGLSLVYSRGLAQVLLKRRLLDQPASQLLALTAEGWSLVEKRRGKVGETAALGLAEVARLVSRQTGLAPTLPLEPNFFSSRFMEEPISSIKHNLNKNQTVELENTRSIQVDIDSLISINSPPKADPPRVDKRLKRKIK